MRASNTKAAPSLNRITPLREMLFICFLFLAVPLLRTEQTLDPSQHLQFVFLSGGLLIYWLINFKTQDQCSFGSKGSKALVLIFLTYFLYSIVSVIIPNNFADALYVFTKTGLYFALLLTFAFIIKGPNTLKTITTAVYVLSSIILVMGYIQIFNLIMDGQLSIPDSTYHISSIFAHRNLFAETLTFTLPFIVYQLVTSQKSWLKLGATINLSLTLILLILLSNRTSWLAVMVAAITVVSLLTIKRRFHINTMLFVRLSIPIMVSIATGIAAVYHFSDKASLNHHITTSFDPQEGSTNDRLKLWDRSVQLIAEKPLFGHGLDTWKIQMLKYGSKDYDAMKGEVFYQRPHNDFLWVMAEQGVIGGSLYLLFFICLFALAIITYTRSANLEDRRMALLVTTTIVLYACFSMLSFPKEIIFHNTLLFSMAGLLISRASHTATKQLPQRRPIIFLILTSLLLAFIIGSYRLYGDVHTKKAIGYRKQNKPQECLRHINRGQSIFYKVDATSTPLDWYAGSAWFQLKDYKKSESHFKKAYAINPYHLFVTNDYAGSLFKNGQTKEAIQKYLEALELAPKHLDSRLNLCALYFNQNNLIHAFEMIAQTEPDEASDRYKHTLQTVTFQLLNQHLSKNKVSHDNNFIVQFHNNQENYYFYKALIKKYEQYNGNTMSFFDQLINDHL